MHCWWLNKWLPMFWLVLQNKIFNNLLIILLLRPSVWTEEDEVWSGWTSQRPAGYLQEKSLFQLEGHAPLHRGRRNSGIQGRCQICKCRIMWVVIHKCHCTSPIKGYRYINTGLLLPSDGCRNSIDFFRTFLVLCATLMFLLFSSCLCFSNMCSRH